MRFFGVIMVIAILMGLFFVALDSMADYGISSLILAGISIFALYRVFKYLCEGHRAARAKAKGGTGSKTSHNLIDYMIFGDANADAKDWEDE
ncbi:MAG: hypothetical protein FWC75_06695 [Oscillospiraceae bacterium]|nr:hypothetical protein [Oscillospiraceae bacterium]